MTGRQVAFMQRLDQFRARLADEKNRVLEGVADVEERVELVTMLERMDKTWGEVEDLVRDAGEKGYEGIPSDRIGEILAGAEEEFR